MEITDDLRIQFCAAANLNDTEKMKPYLENIKKDAEAKEILQIAFTMAVGRQSRNAMEMLIPYMKEAGIDEASQLGLAAVSGTKAGVNMYKSIIGTK
mgnify:CR=1 FL=1